MIFLPADSDRREDNPGNQRHVEGGVGRQRSKAGALGTGGQQNFPKGRNGELGEAQAAPHNILERNLLQVYPHSTWPQVTSSFPSLGPQILE